MNPKILFANSPAGREMRKAWGTTIGAGVLVLKLAELAGYKVEWKNTSSSDFMKARKGNVTIDMWGGALPAVRSMARIADIGTSKDSDPYQEALQYFRYKANPTVSMALSVGRGKNVVGEKEMRDDAGKITPGSVGRGVLTNLSPIVIRDIAQLWGENIGAGDKIVGSGLTILGSGVQVMRKKKQIKTESLVDAITRLAGQMRNGVPK